MKTEPSLTSGMILPALRARFAGSWYYAATMTFADVARFVKRMPDVSSLHELKTRTQSELRPNRAKQISQYLLSQPQRFFNAIVVGICGGNPEWIPVTVGKSLTVEDVKLDERQAKAFGFIRLTGTELLFAIDGQHRVAGIKSAIARCSKLASEELTVIFVACPEEQSSTWQPGQRDRRAERQAHPLQTCGTCRGQPRAACCKALLHREVASCSLLWHSPGQQTRHQ